MTIRLSSLSTEYVYVPVSVATGVDPTANLVEMAFVTGSTEPAAEDWNAAEWEPGGPPYRIQCLVGGQDTDLADGTYNIWIRIDAAPESIVRRAGTLVIT